MADRHFWNGAKFWTTAFRIWAVRSESPLAGLTVSYLAEDERLLEEGFSAGPWRFPEATRAIVRGTFASPALGARLVADFDGEALVRLDGAPAFGINPYHRSFILQAEAHRPLALEIEVVPRGLEGRRLTDPQWRRLAVQVEDESVRQAAWDLAVLAEWAQHGGTPEAIRDTLARDVEEALHPVTALQPDARVWDAWLRQKGPSGDDEQLYEQVIRQGQGVAGLSTIPWEVLEPRLREAGQRLRNILTNLAHRYPKSPGTLVALGHAHIDLAWLWPIAETRRKIIRTVASQMNLLERYPTWAFLMSSPEMWLGLEEEEPGLFGRLAQASREGRVEPAGAFWVESDSQLLQPQSFIHHLVKALTYFSGRTGKRPRMAFLPDTFGFGAGLPTLLKAAGIELFLTTKINWNDTTVFPYKDFWWVGPDGSRVQAQIFGDSPNGYNGLATIDNVRKAWDGYQAKGGEGPLLYTFGWGDGGGGPTEDMLERLVRYQEMPLLPEIHWGGSDDLAAGARPHLPEYRGELYLEYHRGVFTTQTWLKALNRRLETELMAAEAWCAWLGLEEPLFDDAWRRVLRNHFHDILPGSSIAQVYHDAHEDLRAAEDVVAEAEAGVLRTLTSGGEDLRLLLMNRGGLNAPPRLAAFSAPGGSWEVQVGDQWVPALPTYDGQMVVPIPGLPRLSVLTLQMRAGEQQQRPVAETPETVTVHWGADALRIGPEGMLSWTRGGRELLMAPAGLRAFWNHPSHYDAWEIQPGYRDQQVPLTHEDPVVVEDNAYRTVVKLSHRVLDSAIQEHVVVDKVHGRIQVRVDETVDTRRLLVRWELPTTLVAEYAEADGVWGTTRHATVARGPQDAAQFEWVAHRFVNLAEPHCGVALMNDGRYGHSVSGGTIGATLSTAPLYPDPAADARPVPVHLELIAHDGQWTDAGVMQEAQAWSHGVIARAQEMAAVRSLVPFPDIPENLQVLGLKPAADGSRDLILYLGEMWGDAGSLHWGDGVRARRVSLIDEVPDPEDQADAHRFGPRSFMVYRLTRQESKEP